MSRSRCSAFAAALLLAVPAAASIAEIRGTVYEGDRDHPVPGALIALYDAGDLLVDSTYARDDGAFRLRPPQEKGSVYVVATRGGSSRRVKFDYDPAAGASKNVTLVLPKTKKGLVDQAGRFLLSTLGAVFGTVVGLGAGLLFRTIIEEPVKAKFKRDLFLSDLRAAVEEALAQYPAAAPGARLGEITAAVGRIRKLLDRRTDMEDVLSSVDKKQGRAKFRDLMKKVKDVEDLLAGAHHLAANPQDESLRQAKGILEELRDRPLG